MLSHELRLMRSFLTFDRFQSFLSASYFELFALGCTTLLLSSFLSVCMRFLSCMIIIMHSWFFLIFLLLLLPLPIVLSFFLFLLQLPSLLSQLLQPFNFCFDFNILLFLSLFICQCLFTYDHFEILYFLHAIFIKDLQLSILRSVGFNCRYFTQINCIFIPCKMSFSFFTISISHFIDHRRGSIRIQGLDILVFVIKVPFDAIKIFQIENVGLDDLESLLNEI